jgi:ferric-dicitrate binding protein FerR (iron transport regulator)
MVRGKSPWELLTSLRTVLDAVEACRRSLVGVARSLLRNSRFLVVILILPTQDPQGSKLMVALSSSLPPPVVLKTLKGEHRSFDLRDGWVVYLDTQSELWIWVTPKMRVLELKSGRAQFIVHHDPLRPFRVLGGAAVADALGTQFVVDERSQHRVVVVVLEGAVRVSRRPSDPGRPPVIISDLSAAQQVAVPDRFDESPTILSNLSRETLRSATAWTEGELYLPKGARLSEVIDELKRYNTVDFIVDPELGRIRLGGARIPLNDIPKFLRSLHHSMCVSSQLTPTDTAVPTYTLRRDRHCRPGE